MAEALFNKYAKGRFEVISAGTVPGNRLIPWLLKL